MFLSIISIVVAVLALISSTCVGIQQVKINKEQLELNNKVELYMKSDAIELREMNKDNSGLLVPGIIIQNARSNTIYLEKYFFNGNEYPLGKEVLPPISECGAYHYIYLPTDDRTHVSLEVFFLDWHSKEWKTVGYADYQNGQWVLTYSPCTANLQ